jgi:hypothetical protein
MKKLWLLLLMVTPLQLIHAQEVKHAPTVEQCRADQKLWLSKLELANDDLKHVSYNELIGWQDEMNKCAIVDPENGHQYRYTTSEILYKIATRLADFVQRNNLWGQFQAEDDQGCRGPEPCKPQGKGH